MVYYSIVSYSIVWYNMVQHYIDTRTDPNTALDQNITLINQVIKWYDKYKNKFNKKDEKFKIST